MEANASNPTPTISLLGHIADEYGLAPGTARDMLRTGEILIGDDADHLEKFDGDFELVPLDFIGGKTVRVKSEIRTVQFVYRQPLSQRFG